MLIGFYGVTPNVEILLRDITKPIERLCFLFVGDRGEGEFKVSIQLVDEGGKEVAMAGLIEMHIQDPTRRLSTGIVFASLSFPRLGRHTLKLLVDGKEHYVTTFEVSEGKPEDF